MQNVSDILNWYKKNFRELPWRETRDPYKIWVSEIILQQTRIAQGISYYYRFIEKFPDVHRLASASNDELMQIWQGLGYYSRALNLHKTALIISTEYKGVFPQTEKELLSLPGIGEYTAAAILSFAYKKPYPVLDGNVYRVLSRLYDIDLPIDMPKNKQVFKEILYELIPEKHPDIFNNAMMELGALVCKPDKPDCSLCPVHSECLARTRGTISSRPVKKAKVAVKELYFCYYLFRYSEYIFVRKRSDKGIWKNLYELPLLELNSRIQKDEIQRFRPEDSQFSEPNCSFVCKDFTNHFLTHRRLNIQFYTFDLKQIPDYLEKNCLRISMDELTNYPMPVPIKKFLLTL